MNRRRRNSILTFVEFFGFVGTVVTTARAAPKVAQKIKEVEVPEDSTLSEKAIAYTKAVAKDCVTPLIFGSVTLTAMLTKEHQYRSQAAIASSYTLGKRLYDENKERIKEIVNDISPDTSDPAFFDNIEESKNGFPDKEKKDIFYLEWSGRRFKSTLSDVEEAIRFAVDQYNQKGCISFNNFYLYLGINETKLGVENGFADMGRMNDPNYPEKDWEPLDIYIREIKDPKRKGKVIYMICTGNSVEHVWWYEALFDYEGPDHSDEIWNSL